MSLEAPLQRYYRAFLGLWCLGAAYASFAQLALQELGAQGSNWGYTPGWQREIGFWNIGLIAVLIPILRRGTADIQLASIRALVLLSALFGTNHAVEVFRGGHVHLGLWSHVGGWAENCLAVAPGIALLVATWRQRKRAA
jgi:KinB signaling pathway activation protein